MKYKTSKEFLKAPEKRILIMGLSGVGKTTIARMMPSSEWFHFSVDYRIWTHHLTDQLNDFLKSLAYQEPRLRELLNKDAISVEHRLHFDNLFATSVYMGMLGDPNEGGSNLDDFINRMKEYAGGEINAMLDIPYFIERAKRLYNYPNFLVDASGSLCEVVELDDEDDRVLKTIEDNCLIVYIEATKEHEAELIRRAKIDPKPIYYRPDFVEKILPELLNEFKAKKVEEIDPKNIGSFIYPKLLAHRIPRYEKIAGRYGYTISMTDVMKVKNPDEFLALIAKKIDSKS